jgi:NAD(P) transhydrogenase subunit alpha
MAMPDLLSIADRTTPLAAKAAAAGHLAALAHGLPQAAPAPFVSELTVFVLAVFVGYHVVWRVTPALHSPLMSVTNAISSVIIVGALIAAGPFGLSFAKVMGFIAVTLASVNIFGGFIVTQRMLQMFHRKKSR